MDYSKLRGRIIEKYETVSAFSKALESASQPIYGKLNGNIGITRDDIIKWSKMLDIPQEEIGIYFFTEKVKRG